MPAALSKPLAEITAADVAAIVAEQLVEDDALELKGPLPAKGLDVDPWERGDSRIGDTARNKILAEVIALANAHGGHVILGIDESDDAPKRAAALHPLRACMELAEKLRLQARDCVEPQLPIFETIGVPTQADGAGVVILRVPQSRLAPHRLRQGLEAFYRRADRSEPMTMREIQDLTIERLHSSGRREEQFAAFSTAFRAGAEARSRRPNVGFYASVRTSLVPVEQFTVPDLHHLSSRFFGPGPIGATLGQTPLSLDVPMSGFDQRPILRGIRLSSAGDPAFNYYRELFSDGRVNFTLYYDDSQRGEGGPSLYGEWILGQVLGALLMADMLRREAGAPAAELALEVELYRPATPITVEKIGGNRLYSKEASLESNPLVLPRLSLGVRDEIVRLVDIVAHDLYSDAGVSLEGRHLSFALPALK